MFSWRGAGGGVRMEDQSPEHLNMAYFYKYFSVSQTEAVTAFESSADLGPLAMQHPVSPILRRKNVLATLQLLAKSIWHPKSKVACTHRGKANVYGMDTDAGISERFKKDHPSVAPSRLPRCCAPPHPRLRVWPGREGAPYGQPFPLP